MTNLSSFTKEERKGMEVLVTAMLVDVVARGLAKQVIDTFAKRQGD